MVSVKSVLNKSMEVFMLFGVSVCAFLEVFAKDQAWLLVGDRELHYTQMA
jgi:hypothetical protein